MSTLKLTGAYMPIELDPGPKTIELVYDGSPTLTGTWVGKVRDTPGAAAVALDFSSGITVSGSTVTVVFTEAQLLGLIASGQDRYDGWYGLELNYQVHFFGPFVVDQKASR